MISSKIVYIDCKGNNTSIRRNKAFALKAKALISGKIKYT
jgi:hypothetical protein